MDAKKIAMGVGLVLLLAGLALLSVGAYGIENACGWGFALVCAGGGAVVVGGTTLAVSFLFAGRAARRESAAKLAALPENESILAHMPVRFTERGMELRREVVFEEIVPCVPYSEMTAYRTEYRFSPRRKAKERSMLLLPAVFQDDPFFSQEGKFLVPLDERTERLALGHGVRQVDKRCRVDRAQKPLKRFGTEEKRRVARILGWIAVLLALIGGIVGVGVWLVQDGAVSAAAVGGIGGFVAGGGAVGGLPLFRRYGVTVYEKGVLMRFPGQDGDVGFVPADVIERIERVRLEEFDTIAVCIDLGFEKHFLADGGLFDCLRERFPEKTEDRVRDVPHTV